MAFCFVGMEGGRWLIGKEVCVFGCGYENGFGRCEKQACRGLIRFRAE